MRQIHAESSRKSEKVYEPDLALLVHHDLEQIQFCVQMYYMNCSIVFALDYIEGKRKIILWDKDG